MSENTDAYVEDVAHGENWTLYLGDSCERLSELPDNSIDLSVQSPPFASLFTYSPSMRDLGNSSSRTEFVEIRAFQDAGWIFNGEVTVWKDPQAQSIRTRSHALAFQTKNRDSSKTRPALADYLLLFRKPGDNLVPIKNDVTNDEWIDWASPIWTDHHEGGWLTEDGHICPVWYGIRETDTLNTRVAKESDDERHICPLQLVPSLFDESA